MFIKKFLGNTFKYIYTLESKIAFYPAIFSLLGIVFAFLMFYLESKGISGYLVKNAPILVVNDTETARSLLTTFVAGLISIMVFSFSMVMILLNQASSNFSPRVLPGLISNTRHQIILGIYNASLLYCIFTLVSIEPDGNEYQLPGFAVLLAIVFMTLCLGAFIYFIHSISQEIQVNNIMRRIVDTAKIRLVKLIDLQKPDNTHFPDSENWYVINSHKSGYIQDVSIRSIAQIAENSDIQFEIVPVKGAYILESNPIIKCSKNIEDELKEKVLDSFHYSKSELIEDNYLHAFKHLTEIALKAMSPGINDPGTAVNAIDYITELLALRLQKCDKTFYFNTDDKPLILVATVSFKELIYNVMTALRTYCKHDVVIIQKLFQMLKLLLSSKNIMVDEYKKDLINELEYLYEDATKSLTNEADLKRIESIFNDIKLKAF